MNDIAVKQETMPQEASAVLALVERVAMNPDADMDKLERLLDMQERVLVRNAMVAFNAAMADMQSDIPTIEKNGEISVNQTVRSKYARFEDIMRVVKPVMQAHGFAITFRTNTENNMVKVTGVLMHKDGHREETDMVLPVDSSGSKNTVQAIGSSTAYGKRYVLCALLNIATGDEDDDGASGDLSELLQVVKDIEAAETMEALHATFKAAWTSFHSTDDRKRS
jgi:hypothetical protein